MSWLSDFFLKNRMFRKNCFFPNIFQISQPLPRQYWVAIGHSKIGLPICCNCNLRSLASTIAWGCSDLEKKFPKNSVLYPFTRLMIARSRDFQRNCRCRPCCKMSSYNSSGYLVDVKGIWIEYS